MDDIKLQQIQKNISQMFEGHEINKVLDEAFEICGRHEGRFSDYVIGFVESKYTGQENIKQDMKTPEYKEAIRQLGKVTAHAFTDSHRAYDAKETAIEGQGIVAKIIEAIKSAFGKGERLETGQDYLKHKFSFTDKIKEEREREQKDKGSGINMP